MYEFIVSQFVTTEINWKIFFCGGEFAEKGAIIVFERIFL